MINQIISMVMIYDDKYRNNSIIIWEETSQRGSSMYHHHITSNIMTVILGTNIVKYTGRDTTISSLIGYMGATKGILHWQLIDTMIPRL